MSDFNFGFSILFIQWIGFNHIDSIILISIPFQRDLIVSTFFLCNLIGIFLIIGISVSPVYVNESMLSLLKRAYRCDRRTYSHFG